MQYWIVKSEREPMLFCSTSRATRRGRDPIRV